MANATGLEKEVEESIRELNPMYQGLEFLDIVEVKEVRDQPGKQVSVVLYDEYIMLKKIRRLALCVSMRDPEFEKYMVKLQDALAEYYNQFEKGKG